MNQLPLTLLKPEDIGGSESQIDGLAVDDLIASHFHARGEAHVRTDLSQWEGMNHGFLFWVNHVDAATEAMREANAWLRRIFG